MFDDIRSFYTSLISSISLMSVSRNEIQHYLFQGDFLLKKANVNKENTHFSITVNSKSDISTIYSFIQSLKFFEDCTLSKNVIIFKPVIFTQEIIEFRKKFLEYIIEAAETSIRKRRLAIINEQQKIEKNRENLSKFRSKIDLEAQKCSETIAQFFKKNLSIA